MKPQHGLDHVGAVLAAHPRGAHDRGVGPGARARRPASTAPYTDSGLVGSSSWYGAIERAVEHVVGADVHEVGADVVARLAHPAHRVGVVARGSHRVGLAGVDRGPRGGVDHDVGPRTR